MARSMMMVLGGLVTLLLLVGAIWAAMHAAQLVAWWGVGNTTVARWAIYSAALGAAAAGHIVLLNLVIDELYPRDLGSEALKLMAGLLSTIALVCAVALGLASR